MEFEGILEIASLRLQQIYAHIVQQSLKQHTRPGFNVIVSILFTYLARRFCHSHDIDDLFNG